MERENLDQLAKCRNCKFYDPTPYPQYGGKLARCTSPDKDFIGVGKIGWYTLAHSSCYEAGRE